MLYFLKRKLFLYFGKRKNRTNFLYLRKRNVLIFQEVTFRTRKIKNRLWKNLIKLFKTLSPQKNVIKLFYTLNKTPLGEAGCLSNLYYLLVAQPSIFVIHFLWLTGHHATPEVTTFISFFLTYGTPCYARSHYSHLLPDAVPPTESEDCPRDGSIFKTALSKNTFSKITFSKLFSLKASTS